MTTSAAPNDLAGRPAPRRHTRSHPPRRHRAVLFGLVAVIALVAASCGDSKTSTDAADGSPSTTASGGYGGYGGGSSTSATSATSATSSTTAASGAATTTSVAVGTTTLGDVIVDSEGFTLYLYEPDTGPTSTCLDACAEAWPPAKAAGTPSSGSGVTGALTTTTRPDGSTQIVLAGHPLYRYKGDAAPGDVTGQDVGGIWYAVSPAGAAIEG